MTLTFDRERGVITVPLPNGLGKKTVTLLPDPDDAPVPEQLSAAASNPVSRVQEVLK